MNSFEIKYNSNLRTSIKHIESDKIINTDAPKDNHGLGQSFHLLIWFASLLQAV